MTTSSETEQAEPLVTPKQLAALRAAVTEGNEKPVLIAIHDYPDPDALASALALQVLGHSWGVASTIAYGGGIGRAENGIMVNLLGLETTTFQKLDDLSQFKGALITDTQPAAKNQSLPGDIPILAVIDHHQLGEDSMKLAMLRSGPDKKCYYDVRLDVGSSSTLLTGYLLAAGLIPDARLATALFIGIKTDTDSLMRDAKRFDSAAYTQLIPLADMKIVSQISHPPLSQDYYRFLDKAMNNAWIYDNSLICNCGDILAGDIISTISDMMIQTENVSYALAYGVRKDRIYLSLRAKPPCEDATRVMLETVGPDGKGGGHNLTAGGFMIINKALQDHINEMRQRFLKVTGSKAVEGVALL